MYFKIILWIYDKNNHYIHHILQWAPSSIAYDCEGLKINIVLSSRLDSTTQKF